MRLVLGRKLHAAVNPVVLLGALLVAGAPAVQAGPATVAKAVAGNYARAEQRYRVPDVTLRDRHDRPVKLRSLLAEGRPIVLQFIFTSCETVCPMLTATTAQAQAQLRSLDPATQIVSISLDPDYDTPRRMADYAGKFGAAGDWRFLTGDRDAIRATLTAFDAMYPGRNKMYHKPYTFIRAASSKQWVRLAGLLSSAELVAEYRRVLVAKDVAQRLAAGRLTQSRGN